ncbi:Spore coat U domain protein [Novosphingobium sp. KN65.2]|nr:Spore coat U domain protein [Novosphingobium sp. KN65.2]
MGAGLAAVLSTPAMADTTTTFQVSATVVSGCEINGALASNGEVLGRYGQLDFGTHSSLSTDTASAAIAADAGLTLSCTPGIALSMALGAGQHGSATRNMQAAGSSDLLPYRLYRDPAFSNEMQIDQAYAITFADPEAIALPIYGRVVLSGDKPPDTYSDTVVLTLSW